MPDPTLAGFVSVEGETTHWYQCQNLACGRWLNIRLYSSGIPGQEADPYAQGYATQMNLHMMFCPMCGHKHGT